MIKFIQIDEGEIFLRLLEKGIKLARPSGKTNEEAIAEVYASADAGKIPQDILDDFKAMTLAVCDYFGEQLKAAQVPH